MTETLVKEKSVKLFAPVREGSEQRSASEGETSPYYIAVKKQLKELAEEAWGQGTYRSNVYNSNLVRVINDNANLDKKKVMYDRRIESYIYDENGNGAVNAFRSLYAQALEDEIKLKLSLRQKENELIMNDLLEQERNWNIQMSYILSVADSEWLKAEKRINKDWNNWRSDYASEYEKTIALWNESYTEFQNEKRDWIISAYMNAGEGKWNELTAGYDIEREKIVNKVMEKSGLSGRIKDSVTALSEDTEKYVRSITDSALLANIMNYADSMTDRAKYGIKKARRGNVISTQADDWLKDALDRSAATRKEYEKTAEKLSEQKAAFQLQETIDGYMAQIDAQNKGMRDWEIQTVQSSGYRVNGRRIERTAIIDSTLMGNVKKTQTVAMYEDFKTARPEAELSASDGQNAQNAMERILLAMDNVKKWAVKIFGKKDADGKTVERLVKRRSRKESSEDLLKNYEQRAKEYDEENKNLTAAGFTDKTEGGKYVKLSDGALSEWTGYAPVFKSSPDFRKDKKDNVKYQGSGQMRLIMLDIQWNAMEEGNGLAELAKPMYDKKMWDDDGAIIQPPTFRAVTDIVLDIVGNVTGHMWIGFMDDLFFAATDLTGGYKTAEEVGLELGKKALVTAVSFGIGSAGKAASTAASSAITGTAANVAAQAGISTAQSYATSVASNAINSVNIVNGELKFDGEGFGRSLYSAGTIASAVSAGVAGGLNAGIGEKLKGMGDRGAEIQKFYGSAINMGVSAAGKAGEYAVYSAYALSQGRTLADAYDDMGGISLNLLDAGMIFDIIGTHDARTNGTGQSKWAKAAVAASGMGLFELNIGSKGFTASISSGGINIGGNLYTLGKRMDDKAALQAFRDSNDKKTGDAAWNAYVYGDWTQENTAARLASGLDQLEFVSAEGKEKGWTAQTTSNGKGGRSIQMVDSGDSNINAIQLGHEAYRNGIKGNEADQKAETRAAVTGHAGMAGRMMGYKGNNISGFYALEGALYNQGRFDLLNKITDGMYDSSADYWRVIRDENGKIIDIKDDEDYDNLNVVDENGNPIETVTYLHKTLTGEIAALGTAGQTAKDINNLMYYELGFDYSEDKGGWYAVDDNAIYTAPEVNESIFQKVIKVNTDAALMSIKLNITFAENVLNKVKELVNGLNKKQDDIENETEEGYKTYNDKIIKQKEIEQRYGYNNALCYGTTTINLYRLDSEMTDKQVDDYFSGNEVSKYISKPSGYTLFDKLSNSISAFIGNEDYFDYVYPKDNGYNILRYGNVSDFQKSKYKYGIGYYYNGTDYSGKPNHYELIVNNPYAVHNPGQQDYNLGWIYPVDKIPIRKDWLQ